jgi:protein tyrosine/serine phosphatase
VEDQPFRQAVNMRINQFKKYFVALIILQVAILSIGAATQSSAQSQPIAIKNFGKVNENYYRGSQPDATQFRNLKQLGVKTVIDLRKDKVEEASGWAQAAGLQYINIPLTTKRAATEDQSSYFLKLVNDPANWPIYVHCKGGRHRTGEMTAIYRITRDGWTADQAYREMKNYDFEDSLFYPRVLKKYVFSYYEQFNAAKDTSISAP